MSFILSALKKVENKRNLGSVPELSSIQIQGFENPDDRRHRLGIVLSIAGIVSAAIFAALWLYQPLQQQNTAEQKIQSVLITSPASDGTASQAAPTLTTQPPVAQTPPHQTNIVPTAAVLPNTIEPAAPYVVRINPAPIYYPPQPQTFNSNVAAQSPAHAPEPSPHLYQNPIHKPEWEPLPVGIVNYEDLPNGLRQRIPNIQLSAHIHSDLRPQARKVIINGVALREGQRLSNDLSVHQINPDGVIMDYQGTLFLLNKTSIFN